MALSQAKSHSQGHEPLLGAIVEVTLQAAPLVIASLQQARPAGLHITQRLAEPGP